MTLYYAKAEIPHGEDTAIVRAFWDKDKGHGADVVLKTDSTIEYLSEPFYTGSRGGALNRFATMIRRMVNEIYMEG